MSKPESDTSDEFNGPISGRFVSPGRAHEVAAQEIQKKPSMSDYWKKACNYVGSKNGAEFDDFDREFSQWEDSYFAGYPRSIRMVTDIAMPFDQRVLAWMWMTE